MARIRWARSRRLIVSALVTVSALAMVVTPTFANSIGIDPPPGGDYTVDEVESNFGHLDQNLVGVCGVSQSCGPVAAVNSFVYLEHIYSGIYGGKLISTRFGDDVFKNEADTVDTLCGAGYMNCNDPQGTNINDFISGKTSYLRGTPTDIHSQNVYDPNNPTRPTIDFLYTELKDHEDVELLLETFAPNGTRLRGHYVTLHDLEGIDFHQDGFIHQSDHLMFSFIDPDGGVARSADIYQSGVGSFLRTSFGVKATDPAGTLTFITADVSESPTQSALPEPSSFTLVVVGMAAMIVFCRRRREV